MLRFDGQKRNDDVPWRNGATGHTCLQTRHCETVWIGVVDGRSRPHNGRYLRHRPKRSERCLNYGRLHQGSMPKSQGVPEGP
ncbi:MAG TPA: hypothetical protein DDW52_10400 [Planctomycetaceae bacterium]|nr:hypothetical protein [Planctomycetaceae bacterium]